MTAATGDRIAIRPAVPRDAAAVRACAEEAYGPYVAAIGRAPAPMVADFAGQIAQGAVHVAEDGGERLTGFIVFFPRGGHMFLENVAVGRAAAGQGVGKALIGLCEAEARRRGLASVRLCTNEKMTANLSIYPHLGYVETERRRQDGFDRVFFEKQLS